MWCVCPNCHRDYGGPLSVALAAGYLKQIMEVGSKSLVGKNCHNLLLCEAHKEFNDILIEADKFQALYLDEIWHLSNRILKKLIPKIQTNYLPRQRQLELEADLHNGGLSYYAEMKEDYETAIELKKRALELFELLNSGAIELSYEQDYEGEKDLVLYCTRKINTGKS